MTLELTRQQIEQFRDALVAAFGSWDVFDEFAVASGVVGDLELDVGGKGGPLKTVARDFLKKAKSDGALGEVLKTAVARSANPALRAFAGPLGYARIGAAHEFLTKTSFDLRDQEEACTRALARIDRGLAIFVLCGAEHEVTTHLVARLRGALAARQEAPAERMITLRAMLGNVNEALNAVGKWKTILAGKHVLTTVYADAASDEVIGQFIDGVRREYAGPLAHDLMLVLHAAQPGPWSDGLHVLPQPRFEDWHLYVWADSVTAGKGWPADLMKLFKTWLRASAQYDQAVSSAYVYETLSRAIEVLSQNPNEAAFRQFLQSEP